MLYKIKDELDENKIYIYLAYLISILTTIPQFIASPSLNSDNHLIFIFILLLILFFIAKFNKLLFSIFIIYLNLTNIIIGHIFIHWGYANADIGPRIEVSAISPRYEILEYLMTYIDFRDILLVIYSFFVLVILYKFLVHFRHSFKIVKFLGFIVAILLVTVLSQRNLFTTREPFSILKKFIVAGNSSQLYHLRTKYLNGLETISMENKNSIYDKIIIILGEAVNKHHMSIYNYDKNTTPFLASLKSKDNLYIFNAIAPTNQTRYSVPILYTQANVHDFSESFVHSRSIIGNFNMYNYKTYWISNQGEAGKHDSSIASMAQEANIYHFLNVTYASAKPDEQIFPYLKNIKNNSNKEMYLIHLIGSHVEYIQRYTKKHILFKDAMNIEEEYDNTIYYTDYILQNIFMFFLNKFQNKKILFVYISDHGEVVSEDLHGHGYLPPYKDEYDVPFVVYSNIKNDRIDKLYKNNKKGYFNLENLNYMIEYISGVSDDDNISYSSDVFALDPKNIFNYNKLEFYK